MRRGRSGLWAPLILGAVLLAYLPAIRGGFIWDDDDYVTHNSTLHGLDGLGRIWFEMGAVPQYYPLVHTTFWIEHHLWGDQPLGYHLDNVVLHALSAVLLGVVLLRLSVPGAWFAALVFALHPVHVESVAWITERKNVLSTFFYLAAVIAYLRFSRLDAGTGDSSSSAGSEGFKGSSTAPRAGSTADDSRRFYVCALALFLCALLSKTVACSFPAAILLLVWWKRGRVKLADVLPLIPFFALGGALGLTTMWMEKHHVGALGKEWELTIVDRILVAGRALWFYAAKLVWPRPLIFVYPRWRIDAGSWWQYLFPLSAVTVIGVLWALRRKIGRGPLIAVLFFAGTLVPALGFFDVYPMRFSFVADHFQYLASIGLIALGAVAIKSIFLRLAESGSGAFSPGRSTYLQPAFFGSLLVILGVLTWNQAHVYKDLESLWRDTLQKNPGSWMPHYNLGLLLDTTGRLDEAIAQYSEALRLQPDLPDAENNLGAALDRQGKPAEALSHYESALRLRPGWPDALSNLAWTLATNESSRYRDAARAVRLAEQACTATGFQQPTFLDTLAAAYAEAGRFEDARRTARSALELATSSRLEVLARQIRSHLVLFEADRPYHETDADRKAGKPPVLGRHGIEDL